jgi:UDPglucose 6-dehydrogenase
MKLIIAGYGFVGTAVGHSLSGHHELIIVDPRFNKTRIADHPDADAIIVCVGTPSTEDGDCDISQVMDVLVEIPNYKHVMIKSTVAPDKLLKIQQGFPKLKITYSPEFLRAVSATKDFAKQTYMILGGEDTDIWKTVFRPALKHCTQYITTSMATASMVKYSINTFLSTKVAYFNHMYDLCQSVGVNYDEMQELVKLDPRIGDSHLQVPGPDGSRGFGGHCFPKDTEAFSHFAQRQNLPFDLLDTAISYNKALRKS